jgi:hypothetical protein
MKTKVAYTLIMVSFVYQPVSLSAFGQRNGWQIAVVNGPDFNYSIVRNNGIIVRHNGRLEYCRPPEGFQCTARAEAKFF